MHFVNFRKKDYYIEFTLCSRVSGMFPAMRKAQWIIGRKDRIENSMAQAAYDLLGLALVQNRNNTVQHINFTDLHS